MNRGVFGHSVCFFLRNVFSIVLLLNLWNVFSLSFNSNIISVIFSHWYFHSSSNLFVFNFNSFLRIVLNLFLNFWLRDLSNLTDILNWRDIFDWLSDNLWRLSDNLCRLSNNLWRLRNIRNLLDWSLDLRDYLLNMLLLNLLKLLGNYSRLLDVGVSDGSLIGSI